MAIRVLLAEDHQVVREGLTALLTQAGFEVTAEATDGQDAIGLARTTHPDVAVLDISMPLIDGVEAAREIARPPLGIRSILLTRHEEDEYVITALRAGVRGYVLKVQAGRDLIQAITEVHKGRLYLSPGISSVVVDAALSGRPLPSDHLTSRERQVMKLVAEGSTTKEVAGILGVSVKTAESHRTRLMQKLNVHSTTRLVHYAMRHGLLDV